LQNDYKEDTLESDTPTIGTAEYCAFQDLKYKDAIIGNNTSIYDKLDYISRISSPEVLKEIYTTTTSLAMKLEIVRICKNNDIYQRALDERNETLKIAVIKAIHNNLKTKWALGEKKKKRRKLNREQAKLEKVLSVKKRISKKSKEETLPQAVGINIDEFNKKLQNILASEEIELMEKSNLPICDDVWLYENEYYDENFQTYMDKLQLEPEPCKEEITVEENLIKNGVDIDALLDRVNNLIETARAELSAQPEVVVNIEEAEQKEEKEEEINPYVTPYTISQIFSLDTLNELLKTNTPYLDDIRTQIDHVVESQKRIEALASM